MSTVSFDIFILGLKDASADARTQFLSTLHELTGRPDAELHQILTQPKNAAFKAVDRDRALQVVAALEKVGARVEIRPCTAPQPDLAPIEVVKRVATKECPSCGFDTPAELPDCQKCGLVFAKWERESIQRMQREQKLEEALNKANQVREEWVARAQTYLEKHPLAQGAEAPFSSVLLQDEIPFLGLVSGDGPMLLTSRRMLGQHKGKTISIPFELISDVDLGGGLAQLTGGVRMQVSFRAPLPRPEGPVKSLTWSLNRDSAHAKDVILDWAYARFFLCGSCGAKDAEWRLERSQIRFRCMRCATDHEVDLNQAVAIPEIQD